MDALSVGSIVRCREREWVVLPSADPQVALLRPLTGGEHESCGIYLPLANLGYDRIAPARFPLPTPDDVGDAVGAELLWNAARLALRDGAGPFRSLGRISCRPRAYQFVPLLMALRVNPVRLLIADDVGVGKTIEALLIAREMLDRGDARRLCVLCPPYLCDQWSQELWSKFQLESAVVRSGTVNRLERDLPPGEHSVFGYYPVLVASIDYAKSDRHRHNFLQHCPDLVIVDEAHGAAQPGGRAVGQQQRHQLLGDLARTDRHLLLLTATPHSGIEESFRSLLGLLKPTFADLDLGALADADRDDLARHFVQRRRADVERWLGEETPFPRRESAEVTYDLSPEYRALFDQVYQFSRELVRTGEQLSGWKQRIRYWSALALLRCVMSSPAAAQAAVFARIQRQFESGMDDVELDDAAYAPYIYEPTDEEVVDAQPAAILEDVEREIDPGERTRLRRFADLAAALQGTEHDTKLTGCVETVGRLLDQGLRPVVWCRYVATSNYVAEQLAQRLAGRFPSLRVLSITGELADDERRARVAELRPPAVYALVATDCLSEGINLQQHFNAVVHYDLPWNPNRLEQREGRVDRFGQQAKEVQAVLLYGRDNAVDGAVLDVLLRKAQEIRHALGVSVPVPTDSASIMEAVLRALFFRAATPSGQMRLFDEPLVVQVHQAWNRAQQRERVNRTRFAQRAIKPAEVERELQATDSVLGDPDAVRRFVLNACQRLGARSRPLNGSGFELTGLDRLPALLRDPAGDCPTWRVSFASPAPPGADYLGRNHPFVAGLAQHLIESALTENGAAVAARGGALRTRLVTLQTVLLTLRLRFRLTERGRPPALAEEVMVTGFRGYPPDALDWLHEREALRLLADAQPDAPISPEERRARVRTALEWWPELQAPLERLVRERADRLKASHRRVRAAALLPGEAVAVEPHLPPDLLGLVVLVPVPLGVAS